MKHFDNPDTMDSILAQICHLHHSRAHQLLEALGLYRGQPPVLRALWEQEGLTQKELAEKLQNTPATITKMLQRMEKAGFIQRKPDETDQRIMRVYLTQSGRSIKDQVEAIWKRMEKETFQNFTDQELTVLRAYMLRIRANLLRFEEGDSC
jgi:MarR family transcriptional regulator, organic hydroperoxide resistance regulator